MTQIHIRSFSVPQASAGPSSEQPIHFQSPPRGGPGGPHTRTMSPGADPGVAALANQGLPQRPAGVSVQLPRTLSGPFLLHSYGSLLSTLSPHFLCPVGHRWQILSLLHRLDHLETDLEGKGTWPGVKASMGDGEDVCVGRHICAV